MIDCAHKNRHGEAHTMRCKAVAYGVLRCLLWCVMATFITQCGASQHGVNSSQNDGDAFAEERLITMEPVLIRGNAEGAEALPINLRNTFEEADAYYDAKDYEKAIRTYQKLVDATNQEIWVRAALYNIGLAYEGMKDWERSAQSFVDVIRRFPTSDEGRDAYFRLAEALAQLGEFQRIPPLMEEVLQRPDLTLERRIEALVRDGTAQFEMRKFVEAEKTLKTAIRIEENDREAAIQEDRRVQRGKTAQIAIAQANYLLGQIYHEIFSEIRMVLPVSRYKRDLADKDSLFHQAIDWYTKAVKAGDIYWTPQAGYQIAKLYKDYYFDVLASEVPQNFTEEQRDVYFQALREFLDPGLKTTIRMYERALSMAYRFGSQDPVVDTMLKELRFLEEYRETQKGWKEEEALIFKGEHPHSPEPAKDLVFRDDMLPNGHR